MDRHIARDISYASSARSRGGRALIRTVENATGRLRMIRRAEGYEREVAQGRSFWDVMVERYGLSLDVIGGSMDNIPKDGPLILIANHPYGILDGLMMGNILSTVRGDFRILAHRVFRKAEEAGVPSDYADAPIEIGHAAEKALALELLRFPGAVRAVGATLEPMRLCGYLYGLAGAYSSFYDACHVLKAESEELRRSRLRLCALTARVLADGLETLGLPTVERM